MKGRESNRSNVLVLFLVIFLNLGLQNMELQGQNRTSFGIFFAETSDGEFKLRKFFKCFNKDGHDNPRLVAIALDASLGLLGVHRLYLGTSVKVPVIYTMTCGGGCILWLIDLGLLIFTKDITPYMDNPNLFMWTGKD